MTWFEDIGGCKCDKSIKRHDATVNYPCLTHQKWLDAAVKKAVREEREAVVQYLRSLAASTGKPGITLTESARRIERGEHRK